MVPKTGTVRDSPGSVGYKMIAWMAGAVVPNAVDHRVVVNSWDTPSIKIYFPKTLTLLLSDRYCIGSGVIRCHAIAYTKRERSSWGSHGKGVAMRAIVRRCGDKRISRLTIDIHDPTRCMIRRIERIA